MQVQNFGRAVLMLVWLPLSEIQNRFAANLTNNNSIQALQPFPILEKFPLEVER
jgi:hypothetical protein